MDSGTILRVSSCAEKHLQPLDSAVMQWSHIRDVPSPSSRRVQGFKRWMNYADPVIDSSMTYVDKTLPRGESGVAGARQPMGVLDLLALKKEVDSWIGTFLRHSWLKFIFVVGFPGVSKTSGIANNN
jgi:hypothetical protein